MKFIRKALVVTAVAVGGFLAVGGPALAEDVPPPPVTLNADSVSTLTLAAPVVSLIVAFLIPFLNGLVTKLTTSAGVKGLLTLGLSIANGVLANALLADGSAVFTTTTLFTAIGTWVIAVLSYKELYKPFGVTSSMQPDGTPGKLANKGIH